MKQPIDAAAEISKILHEEFKKVWDETPEGYHKINDAYYMGKGLIVTKKSWDEYQEAKKDNLDLNGVDYLVGELKLISNEIKKN